MLTHMVRIIFNSYKDHRRHPSNTIYRSKTALQIFKCHQIPVTFAVEHSQRNKSDRIK